MGFWAIFLLLANVPSEAAQEEDPLGDKVVTSRASFNKSPSCIRGVIRPAEVGEEVKVVGIEETFAKVILKEGGSAYISRCALIAKGQYRPAPSNEKELAEMKAEGYEAGRFDPETEKRYKEKEGPATQKAYDELDALQQRPSYKPSRVDVARRLEAFRKEGHLGEFAGLR